jgi:lysophospholipase L1-like esterase
MFKFPILLLVTFLVSLSAKGEHLFILSGQSNMRGLKPEQSFIPAVQKAFGENQCIVVHSGWSGATIQQWYKEWKDSTGALPKNPALTGALYDKMMIKVNPAIKDTKLTSVTFVWMQGESDTKPLQSEVYKASFLGVLEQLKKDLNITEINHVVGRISDFGIQGKGKNPHWQIVRDVLVELGTESPCGAWVDTDDLNDGKQSRGKDEPREIVEVTNDLHYTDEGYVILGQRFADKSIELINKHSKK